MAKYLVEKSDPLRGEVTISGAKNAVLPLMAAALLSDEPCIINDTPALKDVEIMCKLTEALGAEVTSDLDNNVVEINANKIHTYEAPGDLVSKMRASILVMGPLLARTGKTVISMPGGCAIGDRPIELHLKGIRALGAEVEINEATEVI